MNYPNKCIRCGKGIMLTGFCGDCKSKIPYGMDVRQDTAALIHAIDANESLKEVFQKTVSIGKLQIDTCNNIFHVDNVYCKIYDLEEYSFYTGEPKIDYGIFGYYKVYCNVYFVYRIKGLQRRTVHISTDECHYEHTTNTVHCDPPESLLYAKQLFSQMLYDEQLKLERQLKLMQTFDEFEINVQDLSDDQPSSFDLPAEEKKA